VEEKLTRLEKSLPIRKPVYDEENTPVIPIWIPASRIRTTITAAFSTITNTRYRLAIAAAFTLLVVATIVLFNSVNNGSPTKLFTAYYEPFESQSIVLRGEKDKEVDPQKKLFNDALTAYEKGDFTTAIEIFESISYEEENKITIWMYKGNAYLHEGQIEKAKVLFNNIIQENEGLELQAKWYLSLCYIKNGEFEKAKPLLEDLKEIGGYKHYEADKILSDL
jgi:tetratricopeptide (TPR) repeat protein